MQHRKLFTLICLLSLAACASWYPTSRQSYTHHYGAQVIEADVFGYDDHFSVKTKPSMGMWAGKLGGDKNLEFVENRKKILADAAEQSMKKTCANYKVKSDYNYVMNVPQKTNEPISSIVLTTKESLSPSYDKLPLSLETDFTCK